jgi:small GTP-binding protein
MESGFQIHETPARPAEPSMKTGPPPRSPAAAAPAPRRLVLVGNPNVGKSVIFGALTGTYVTVSNYPGTTVEITRGSADLGGSRWEIIDTPGVNNLVPMSEDEVVTRDILLGERVDAVIQVADAKNLRRALLLSLQLAELEVPFALNLNMVDEARSRGLNFRWRTLSERLGVAVNATVATERRGLKALGELAVKVAQRAPTKDLLRPSYPAPLEEAIAAVAAELPAAPLSRRGLAVMLLAGDETLDGWAAAHLGPAQLTALAARRQALARALGAPVFTIVCRHRLLLCDALVEAVVIRAEDEIAPPTPDAPPRARTLRAAGLAAVATLVTVLAVDGALAALDAARGRPHPDPLDAVTVLTLLSRLCSADFLRGWHLGALALAPPLFATAFAAVRRPARAAGGAARLAVALAASYLAFALLYFVGLRAGVPRVAVHAFGPLALLCLGAFALTAAKRDVALARRFGALAMHRVWGVPILVGVLVLVYKVVGGFGAGTAVKLLEDDLFGKPLAAVTIDVGRGEVAAGRGVGGAVGIEITHVATAAGTLVRATLTAQGGDGRRVPYDGPAAFYARDGAHLAAAAARATGTWEVTARGPGTLEVRAWTGIVNRGLYRLFSDHVGSAFVRDLCVGPYGLLTMALTYSIAIIFPIVAMFFIVFSLMEDSGYLPRLAVMLNRALRPLGLNGKAVLPMILGLGCDTMATLTTRILETRKERLLATLLLALGVPCSAQLGVILGMLTSVGVGPALWWLAAVSGTVLVVGYLAARLLPGEPSDFILEIPPIRRPQLGNILQKTGARIAWYLREAVPLFAVGTLILFVLDRGHALGVIQRAGEPLVVRWLGLPRESAEAFLIGFLRRDFAATKLFDLARGGGLDAVQIVVAMTTITLFIPCVANLIVIAKERGLRVAAAMFCFIFPVAFLVGGVVRRLMLLPWPAGRPLGALAVTVLLVGSLAALGWALGRRRAARRPKEVC